MPVYEYECAACSHHFEEWQKITDKPVKTCPKCNKDEVERLISQTAFHLKGGGWYNDLYSSKKAGVGDGASAKAGSDKAEKKKGEGKDKGGESKAKDSSSSSSSSSSSGGGSGGDGGGTTKASRAA